MNLRLRCASGVTRRRTVRDKRVLKLTEVLKLVLTKKTEAYTQSSVCEGLASA